MAMSKAKVTLTTVTSIPHRMDDLICGAVGFLIQGAAVHTPGNQFSQVLLKIVLYP